MQPKISKERMVAPPERMLTISDSDLFSQLQVGYIPAAKVAPGYPMLVFPRLSASI